MAPRSEAEELSEASHGHGTAWSGGTASYRPNQTRFNCLEHLTEDDTKKLLTLLRSDQPWAGPNGWMYDWTAERDIPHFNHSDVLLTAQAFLQQDYEHREIVVGQAESLGVRGHDDVACRTGRVRVMTVKEVDALKLDLGIQRSDAQD